MKGKFSSSKRNQKPGGKNQRGDLRSNIVCRKNQCKNAKD
jgi:hypothetical protein